MNERMRKLAEEAGIIHRHMSVGEIFDALQKFEKCAELIMRECCNAADDWYQNHNDIHWDPAQHIRNHFGVE